MQLARRQQTAKAAQRGEEKERDVETRRITFLLKCEKPFAVVAVYTLCWLPALSTHCCCCCCCSCSPPLPLTLPVTCHSSFLSASAAGMCLASCLCAVYTNVCPTVWFAVYRSLLLAMHFACEKKRKQNRKEENIIIDKRARGSREKERSDRQGGISHRK